MVKTLVDSLVIARRDTTEVKGTMKQEPEGNNDTDRHLLTRNFVNQKE